MLDNLRKILAPFFSADPDATVYVVECCGRVYAGLEAPTKCRTCPTTPVPVAVTVKDL